MNESNILADLEANDAVGLTLIIIIALLFALSIFPLYIVFSSNSQKILKLFSTFSPDLLLQMHAHLNSFSRNLNLSKS